MTTEIQNQYADVAPAQQATDLGGAFQSLQGFSTLRSFYDAEGDIRVYTYEVAGVAFVLTFTGKARKPANHYRFTDRVRRDAWAQSAVLHARSVAKIKAERKAKAKAERAIRHPLEVGTILSSSWGWEQTNVDFYQVVARTDHTVTLRKIASNQIEDRGHLAGTTTPVEGDFVGEAFTKRADKDGYVRLKSYASASPWSGKPLYWSAYA